MEFKGVKLTEEQEGVVECIQTGDSVKVQAPAGSGKTFILEASASTLTNKNGLYIAFNKAICDSAKKKFGPNVECRTGHSLAYGSVGKLYSHRFGKLTGQMVANTIDISPHHPINTIAAKGYLIIDTIRNFCYSNDPKISTRCVPKIKGVFTELELNELRKNIAEKASELWEKMKDVDSNIPITHDFYLKVWALEKPNLRKDFILFDEAQDANPVMLGVLKNQKNSQIVYVGDRFQQIYSWRGAINAMQQIPTKHSPFLTQSFRFGNEIAGVASDILESYMPPHLAPPRISGREDKAGNVVYKLTNNPNVVICRTNNGVVFNVFKYLEKNKNIYVQGGTSNLVSMLKGAEDLQKGKKTYAPDLVLFNSWDEVLEYTKSESGSDLRGLVNLIQKHGIPTLINALQSTHQSATHADIVLTTGHKSKGLEWEKVQLHSDYLGLDDYEDGPLTQEDINILYVSATRALDTLDLSQCKAAYPETLKRAKGNVEMDDETETEEEEFEI